MYDGYGNIQRIYEESSSLADLRRAGNEMIGACRLSMNQARMERRGRNQMFFNKMPKAIHHEDTNDSKDGGGRATHGAIAEITKENIKRHIFAVSEKR